MKNIKVSIVSGLLRAAGKLPLGFHYSFARFTGWLMRSVLHYRESVVYVNLARSFPEKKYYELERIARDFYTHFGEIIAETIWLAGSDKDRIIRENICTVSNPEVLDRAYKESPNVMLLTSHCGNWELYGGIAAYNRNRNCEDSFREDHIYMAYKKQSSELWDQVLKKNRITPIPDYKGLVESKNILRFVMNNRNRKSIYIFIADQYPYATKADAGEFLHQQTYGMMGSFGLAHKLGMSVVYARMDRTERGHYEMTFVPLADDASKYRPEEVMEMYFRELEKEIQETPANWLWSHKRWK